MVALELIFTKQVATDKKGAGPPLSMIAFEMIRDEEPRRFYVLSA